MSTETGYSGDNQKPSQAEGDDPADTTNDHEVLPQEGKPSQADA